MLKTIIVISLIGIILLLGATVTLVFLNLNQEILAKVVVGVLIGIVTVFTMIFFSLEENSVEKKFSTMVLFNQEEKLPANVLNVTKFAPDAQLIAALGRSTKDGIKPDITKSINEQESIRYLEELIQYKLIRDIATIQKTEWKVGIYKTPQDITMKTAISSLVRPSDLIEVNGEKVLEAFSKNSFSKGDRQFWLHKDPLPAANITLLLPRGTEIVVDDLRSPEGKVDKERIILSKKNYFRIEILIELLIGGVPIPKDIILPESEKGKCRQYLFVVSMKADFDRITSKSPLSVEYRKWAEWLFKEIEEINSNQ